MRLPQTGGCHCTNYHRMTHGAFSIGLVIGDRAFRPFRTGSDVAVAEGEAEIEPNCVLDGPPKNTRLRCKPCDRLGL